MGPTQYTHMRVEIILFMEDPRRECEGASNREVILAWSFGFFLFGDDLTNVWVILNNFALTLKDDEVGGVIKLIIMNWFMVFRDIFTISMYCLALIS